MKKNNILIPFQEGNLSAIICSPDVSEHEKTSCLIICHGAFEYKENFFELACFLTDHGISSLVIDMPGHGESSGKRFHINIPLWVLAISAAIDFIESHPAINSKRIGAFGFSSGGTAVLEAALIEHRLKTLITLDATVRNYLNLWDTIGFKILSAIGIIKHKLTGSDLHLKLVHVLKSAKVAYDPAVNQRIISDLKMIDAYSAFPLPGAAPCAFVDTIIRTHKIKIPTLVMHGEDDHIDPPKTAEMLFDFLSCEKALEILPQSGHCGHLDTHKHQMMQLTVDWALKHL